MLTLSTTRGLLARPAAGGPIKSQAPRNVKTTTLQKLFTSTRHRFVTLLVASAVIASAHAAVPRPTVIDGSFNPDTSGFDVYSLRVAVQSNGKIVIAGAGLGGDRSMISRLNEDSSADASFRLDPAFHSAVTNVQ